MTIFSWALAFIVYTYVVYPALVALLARWSGSSHAVAPPAVWPSVTVIVPAHNEERHIRSKIENILASDYSPDRLRIIVVSDGSSDRTVEEARAVGDSRVRIITQPARRGKVAAIKSAVAVTVDPILVMTDASEHFEPDAIRRLVTALNDSVVGAVSGELKFIDAATGVAKNLGLYWRYEKGIREAESRIGSVVGVTGSIYAIRRDCFVRVPNDTLLDDVAIPFEVVRQGYRVAFESRAVAYEVATAEMGHEFARKRRTLAGNYQLLLRYRDLANPLNSPIAIQFLSHKVFRLLVPYALVAVFVSTWLLPAPWDIMLGAAQIAFYGLALAAHLLRDRARGALFTFPLTFCALNLAAVAGLYAFLSGQQAVEWEKVK